MQYTIATDRKLRQRCCGDRNNNAGEPVKPYLADNLGNFSFSIKVKDVSRLQKSFSSSCGHPDPEVSHLMIRFG